MECTMLPRVGNRIYWMGRYLEKAEYIARFAKVRYLSLMDLPAELPKEAVLASILNLADAYDRYLSTYEELKTEEVLHYINIEIANPDSVLAYVVKLRENASGVRDNLSPELWEYINSYYHSLKNYKNIEDIQAFNKKIELNSFIIKGYIQDCMIRNEAWMMLSLGIYLERSLQVIRTLLHEMKELPSQKNSDHAIPFENYDFILLLESLGAYGMFKQIYHRNANRAEVLHFLVMNKEFPKSISYSIATINTNLRDLSCFSQQDQASLLSKTEAVLSNFHHFDPEKNIVQTSDFLKKAHDNLLDLIIEMESTYLNTEPSVANW
ncbi:alpha-E domain-containing protein [soil metagenome]